MSDLFTKIDPKDIEQLGPENLVRLLHRLLHCEARRLSLQKTNILVPIQTNVADGSRDGLWDAEIGDHEFIPRKLTFYQCKAEHITAAKCRDEVVNETKNKETKQSTFSVKPRVREVLEAGGCYAFFSSKHEIKPDVATELNVVAREELAKAEFQPAMTAAIEFYGSNRIADWVNRFPSAVRFVREVTKGFGGKYYYTIEGWSKLTRSGGTFFQSPAVTKKIELLRSTLGGCETHIIRISGLSGVGKTRLVFEALRAFPDSDSVLRSISDSTIYVRYGEMANDAVNFVANLAGDGYSAIIVVDDCPANIHDHLVEIVVNSQISLITVFHQLEPIRKDTYAITLEPTEMECVVEQILRADPYLFARGEEAIKAVAAFAQGFPQIAKLITEFQRAPTLQELRDREPLFQKLISRGETPDPDTLSTMQALALFRTIGGSAQIIDQHLEVIRKLFCGQVADLTFRQIVQQQREREVLQQIADTLMVVPRPLAVALAADFIQFFPLERWKDVVDKLAAEKLLSAFTRRLEELEFSGKGDKIGKLLLERGFPFGNAEYLLTGTTGSQIFRVLSVLNPSAAVRVATNVLGDFPIVALRDAKDSRRDLVRALEFASWESETFRDAGNLLLRLAAAENEGWANNATAAFRQLFNLYLSGTKVPATERLEIIRDALQEKEEAIRSVAIEALGSGLNFRQFSRMSDSTLSGKRDARLDWHPANRRQELDYWKECYSLLHATILLGGKDAEIAIQTLAKNIGAVLQLPLLQELDESFKALSESVGKVWPEVKDQIRRLLDVRDDLSPDYRAGLERWKGYLTPALESMESKILDTVSQPGWHATKGPDGHYFDVSQREAERLAEEIVEKNVDVIPYLPQLLLGEQQQAFSFGAVLGKFYPQIQELIGAALSRWPKLDPKARNSSFLSGTLRGLGTRNKLREKILDQVAKDPNLIDLLVPISASVNIMEPEDFIRISEAVKDGRLEPLKLRHLIQGQPLRFLADDLVIKEFRDILSVKPESGIALFEVLWLHCHDEPEKFNQFALLFRELVLQKHLPILDGHFGWEWHEATKLLISITDDKEWLTKLAEYVRDTLLESKTWVGTEFLGAVMSDLFHKVPVEAWSVFARALQTGDEFEKYILAEFLGSTGSKFDNTASPLWRLPEEAFRAWARENRDIVPLVLDKMSLYTCEKNDDGVERFKWHPYARILLEEGDDEERLERELTGNLSSFGSTGSRVPYLHKRLALVDELARDENPKLRRIGKTVGGWLKEEIETTERRELNENARFL